MELARHEPPDACDALLAVEHLKLVVGAVDVFDGAKHEGIALGDGSIGTDGSAVTDARVDIGGKAEQGVAIARWIRDIEIRQIADKGVS